MMKFRFVDDLDSGQINPARAGSRYPSLRVPVSDPTNLPELTRLGKH